jgi:phage shock protein A
MSVFGRISKLISANINNMLDQAEDPELMVKELIREMEESIIELRRETVRAVARQKQLEKQIQAAGDLTHELEEKAALALRKGDEGLARQAVGRKLLTERTREALARELEGASSVAGRLKEDLARLEDQAQSARRKRDELIRRKRAAESQLRSQEAARRSAATLNAATESIGRVAQTGQAFESYAEQISQMEAEAEAAHEVLDSAIERELDLQKLTDDNAIEEELERLRQSQSKS